MRSTMVSGGTAVTGSNAVSGRTRRPATHVRPARAGARAVATAPAPTRPQIGGPSRRGGQRAAASRRPMGVPAPTLGRPVELRLAPAQQHGAVASACRTRVERTASGVRLTDRALVLIMGVIATVCLVGVVALGLQFLTISDSPADAGVVAAAQR